MNNPNKPKFDLIKENCNSSAHLCLHVNRTSVCLCQQCLKTHPIIFSNFLHIKNNFPKFLLFGILIFFVSQEPMQNSTNLVSYRVKKHLVHEGYMKKKLPKIVAYLSCSAGPTHLPRTNCKFKRGWSLISMILTISL